VTEHLTTRRKLALEGSRQGIMLLKNTDNTLPLLKNQINSLVVIRPNANITEEILASYFL
jgi:beta-glucosidase-like glycosyl hydrolase